ncbi:MAG: hypothetical protein V4538_15010 [Bacteroidota bacterium]
MKPLIILVIVIYACFFGYEEYSLYKLKHRPKEIFTIDYYISEVEYTFNDKTKDTVQLSIYEKPAVTLKDGNLSYCRFSGSVNSGNVTIANYVRSFKVLSAQYKQAIFK